MLSDKLYWRAMAAVATRHRTGRLGKVTKLVNTHRFNRRDALSGVAGLSVGTLVGCGAASESGQESSAELTGKPRVAIIGAGAGGIAAAYFLGGAFDVDMFESREKIGGHCDTQTVQYQGKPVVVDLGAQFFHYDTHPIYVTLLEELGLYNQDNPESLSTVGADGSLCVFPSQGGWPTLSSTQPLLTPRYLIEFAIFTQAARQAVLDQLPWEVTLSDWINSLPLTNAFKNDVIRPWLAALVGSTTSTAWRASARSILQLYALAFPANVFQGAKTYNSKIGLQGNLQKVLDRALNVNVLVNSPVQALSYDGQAWTVTTPSGVSGPYDAVIVNAPPHASKGLLTGVPSSAQIANLLGQYEYFDVRILIHSDPVYAQANRLFWAAYNAGVDGGECEGSVWLAPFHDKLPNGKTVDLFKSWATHRRQDPKNILLERKFQHPLITPAALPAIRSLAQLQGQNGLYFSGAHYTTAFDLQESAVYCAAKVARALAPNSQTLASLDARLSARGRAGISYEL